MNEYHRGRIEYKIHVSRPPDRDAAVMQIIRYEWLSEDDIRSQVLVLHDNQTWTWHQYEGFEVLPEGMTFYGRAGDAFYKAFQAEAKRQNTHVVIHKGEKL